MDLNKELKFDAKIKKNGGGGSDWKGVVGDGVSG